MSQTARISREQITLGGVFLLVALLLWVYYALVLAPLCQTVFRVGREVRVASRQVRQIREAIAQEPQRRQEQTQLSQAIHALRAALPEEEELPSTITRLSEMAHQAGVTIQTIHPQRSLESFEAAAPRPAASPKTPATLSRGIPIQIDAAAGFHQLGSFLSRVESGAQTIQLQSLRISHGGSIKDPRRHTVKMTLVGFFASPPPEHRLPAEPTGQPGGS